MPRRYPLTAALIALAVAAGCGPRPDPQPAQAPPPENSGADHPNRTVDVVSPDKREEGRGYPDRLPAGLARAVRGDTEVRVESVAVGNQLTVTVSVRTRGEKTVAFADWTDAKSATVVSPDGKTYPLIPPTAEQAKAEREGGAGRPKVKAEMGAGEVTQAKPRVTVLRFDVKAVTGEHVDLDLDGAAVGFTDPIRFRLPPGMLTPPMGR